MDAVSVLLARAELAARRLGPNDAEFAYAVCKLLHRLGTLSIEGHALVMGYRDKWRRLSGGGGGGGGRGAREGGGSTLTSSAQQAAHAMHVAEQQRRRSGAQNDSYSSPGFGGF